MTIIVKWMLVLLGVTEIDSRRAAALTERREALEIKARAAETGLAAVNDLCKKLEERRR